MIGIVLVYRAITLLRWYTDLIPFVQLSIPIIDLEETLLFWLLSAWIFVSIWFAQHLYGLFRPTPQGYSTFLQTRLLWVVITWFVAWLGFWYIFSSGISRFIVIIASVVSLIVLFVIDFLWTWRVRLVGKKLVYRLLIVSNDQARAVRIAEEFFDHDAYIVFPVTIDQLVSLVNDRDGCVIVGAVDAGRLKQRNEQCRSAGKDIYQLAEGHFFEDTFGVPMTVGPLVVTAWRSSPLNERRRVVKRGWDVLIAFIALLLLSPLFFVIGFIIKVTSPGPVFYIQERVGKQKQLFRFVKFRTMWTHLSTGSAYGGEDAEKLYEQLIHSEQNVRVGILPKIADDPRVTPIGRWLRKTSLDELPSLRSVLMGDMSLVWPRPHLPREVAQYTEWHQRLFYVKPWITGYAQLYGRDKVPFDEEAKLDLWYIQHRSLWLDIYVLFATIKVVFWGK
jgi:lipopolysaccharide/colanic/teichoic acid biosynthesis glycosyltransferase